MWVQEPRRSAGTGSLEECWSRDREEGGGVQGHSRSPGPGTGKKWGSRNLGAVLFQRPRRSVGPGT